MDTIQTGAVVVVALAAFKLVELTLNRKRNNRNCVDNHTIMRYGERLSALEAQVKGFKELLDTGLRNIHHRLDALSHRLETKD